MSPRLKRSIRVALAAALCLSFASVLAAADRSVPKSSAPAKLTFTLAGPPPAARWNADKAEERRSKPDPPRVRPPDQGKKLRAWLELAAFSTASTVNYWLSDAFPEDRDFRIDLADQVRRIVLLEGWRFDSNQFSLNWSHILAGAIHYQFGRTNRTSWAYSWMMAMAGSTWWEVVGEPKEVIAINDQIMTGLGAFATGEPWYQIGHFLSHERGALPRVLSFLNPTVKLNHWLDRNDRTAAKDIRAGWRDFSLFAGTRRLLMGGSGTGTEAYFGFHTRLSGLDDGGAAGVVRGALSDTYYSEIDLDFATHSGHAEETRLFTKAVTLGRFVQKLDAGRGYRVTLGLGSAFELFKKRPIAGYDATPVPVRTGLESLHLDEPRAFTDKLAILHVAGPVLDWTVFRPGLRLRTVVEAYGDFAMVNARALNDYSRLHEITGLKTTVFYYGYYYGFGGTAAAGVWLGWRGLRAEGSASFGAWRSVDVLDRFQAEVANNASLLDTRSRLQLGAGWRVPGTRIEPFFEIEWVRRWGRLAEVRSGGVERKTYAGLAYSF